MPRGTDPGRGRSVPGPDTFARLDALLEAALGQPAHERRAFLLARTGGDAGLTDEVLGLCDGAERARARIAGAVTSEAVMMADEAMVGRRLGPYRLIGCIGRGGMGAVFLADRDDEQYRQRVAVKVMQLSILPSRLASRFREERQILAQLQHPLIVRLLDGGTTPEGEPWLAMEYIEGRPLRAHAATLPIRGRVELVHALCGAVQYAHQQLVIHCDIKPGNVLVCSDGSPRLLDFGVARIVDDSAREDRGGAATTRTRLGFITPEYTSPEQARGERATVASDVYSLGALLYDLVTGRSPHDVSDDTLATLRSICEVDPPLPSTLVPAERRAEVTGDLDSILLKALRKEPARRYPSVALLAADLSALLEGRPVGARDGTRLYRAGKFARRHRVALGVTAAVAVALLGTTAVSVRESIRATRHAREAADSAALANRAARTLYMEQGLRELSGGHPGRALPSLRRALELGEDTPGLRLLLGGVEHSFAQIVGRVPVPEGWMANFTNWQPDPRHLATMTAAGVALRMDARGQVDRRFDTGGPQQYLRQLEGAGGDRLVRARGREVTVWSLEAAAVVGRFSSCGPIAAVDTDAAGTVLFVSTSDGRMCAHRLPDGPLLWNGPSPSLPVRLAAAPSGEFIAFIGETSVEVRRGSTGAVIGRRQHGVQNYLVGFTHDEQQVYFWHPGGQWMTWRFASGDLSTIATAPYVSESPDGTRWAISWDDGRGEIVEQHTGRRLQGLDNPTRTSNMALGWSHSGKYLMGVDLEGQMAVLDADSGALEQLIEVAPGAGSVPHTPGYCNDVFFLQDDQTIAVFQGAELLLVRFQPRSLTLPASRPSLSALALSPDDRLLVLAGLNGGAEVWRLDGTTGTRMARIEALPPPDHLWDVDVSRDGRRALLSGAKGFAAIYPLPDAPTGELAPSLRLRPPEGVADPGLGLAVSHGRFHPDGTRVVTASDDATARVWEAATGRQLLRLPHPQRVLSANWSSDGTRIVTAGWDGVARIFDGASGALVRQVGVPGQQLLDAVLSPDGATLVTSGHDGRVDTWDARTGAHLRSLLGHTAPACNIEWSPDGALVATASSDATARVWEPSTGRLLRTFRVPVEGLGLRWSHDGRRLFVAAGALRVFDLPRDDRPRDAILADTAGYRPFDLDESGQVVPRKLQ